MARAADFSYFHTPPMALAHRGGSLYPPNVGLENSLTAFRTAVDLGFTHLETDVHATSDGEVVAFHDDHLDRVSDTRGAIATLPWATVREVRIGGREPIPLLRELFEALPSARFNIDIKAAGAVTPLWRLIEEYSAYDRVCVGSFSDIRLGAFRRLARGRVATAAGPAGTAGLRFLPRLLSAALHSPGAVLQIPETTPLPGGRQLTVVTEALLTAAHALGKQVHVWTIDDPAQMTRLLDLGADGIVTDRPDLLKEVLQARGQWHVPGAGS